MTRLLVAHNLHLPLDPAESALGKPYPPIGPLTALAMARKKGIDSAFYDPMFCHDPQIFEEALKGHRPEKVAILADPHSIPQKQCTRAMRDAMKKMIGLARSYGANVLVAGPDISDHPEFYREASHVVIGEHEGAFQDWIQDIPLPSLIPRRPLIREVDSLPEPAYDEIDLAAYKSRWHRKYGLWELNYSTARGCPYRCNWCAKPTWGRSYQLRSAASVARSILALQERYSPDRFWFTDDIFAIKPSWLNEFADRVEGKIRFRCLTRADLVKDREYVKNLARAGCVEVWLGAESGSDAVLRAMDKDGTVGEVYRASEFLQNHGIRRGFFLQLGYPGEKVADVAATVRMVRELGPEEIGISVSYPLPGTVFHERVQGHGLGEGWAGSMENRVVFQSEFRQEFYDAVRGVLRAEHALLRLGADLQGLGFSKRGARRLAGGLAHGLRWPIYRGLVTWYGRENAH